MNKPKLLILFGGRSAEHEVSLMSAKNIFEAADKNKYDIVLVGISKTGEWYKTSVDHFYKYAENPKNVELGESDTRAVLLNRGDDCELVLIEDHHTREKVDVVFPIIHGTNGEDGTLQGLLKLACVPFVGPSVLGSAVGMDKDVMKRLLECDNIPVVKYLVFQKKENNQLPKIDYEKAREFLGNTVFVKPANAGSSVGINKAKNKIEFETAVAEAFKYDSKILVEEAISGREIECAVMGNENPLASKPGELTPDEDFYSYESKYSKNSQTKIEIPAKVSNDQIIKIQQLAIKTFKTLACEGMARVDFFLKDNGEILVNEINTIPGFTNNSMYPKMWEASGVSQTELVNQLINFAIARFERENKIKTSI